MDLTNIFRIFSIFKSARVNVRHSRGIISVGIISTMSETHFLACAAPGNEYWCQGIPSKLKMWVGVPAKDKPIKSQ